MSSKKWQIKHQGKWYTLNHIVDSGKPSHEEGGGNYYHVDGHEPISQHDIEDIDMSGQQDLNKREDKIPGGLADKKKPSDFDSEKLKAGIKIEMEHTSDRNIAEEIAMDHLTEDSEYYNKLKEIEKYDRVEVTADGKRELTYGKEDLNKEPNLKKRWNKLKKALDSSAAILDLSDATDADESDQDQSDQQDQQNAQPEDNADQSAQPQPDAQPEDSGQDDSQQDEAQKEQEVIDFLRQEGYDDTEIAYIVRNHSIPIPTKNDHAAQNEAAKGEMEQDHLQEKHELSHAHKQEAHEQERKQDDEEYKARLEHKKRMSQVEYEKAKSDLVDPSLIGEHKKKMLDIEVEIANKKKEQAAIEVEHKKRMLDLEYKKAHKEISKEDPTEASKKEQIQFELEMKRMEKQVELEFKKKELALKLKLTEEAAKQKHEHAKQQFESDAVVNAQIKENQAKHKIAESKKLPVKEEK
jgi:hypothetical protein